MLYEHKRSYIVKRFGPIHVLALPFFTSVSNRDWVPFFRHFQARLMHPFTGLTVNDAIESHQSIDHIGVNDPCFGITRIELVCRNIHSIMRRILFTV